MSTIASTHPVILTIATSDSGGGAGVQADLKTITALGGFGTSVFAALTAQNGAEVRGIHAVPPDFVTLQLQTVLDGFPVKAAKTGMLFSSELIETVAQGLSGKLFPLVVDPVSVSQSGYKLLRDDAVEYLIRRIIPLADLLTPNKPEAELLSGIAIESSGDVHKAAAVLLDKGAKAVLIKGGHFSEYDNEHTIVDWLALPGKPLQALPHERVATTDNHGTGCTLSAAIATFLGHGRTLQDSIAAAQDYLTRALASSYAAGIGAGSPDFMVGMKV